MAADSNSTAEILRSGAVHSSVISHRRPEITNGEYMRQVIMKCTGLFIPTPLKLKW